MADARSEILASLAAARPAPVRRPRAGVRPPIVGDPIALFLAGALAAGGECVDARPGGLVGALADLPGYATARHVHSALPGVASRGDGVRPGMPADLAHLDFALIRGVVGAAENGAVWHEPGDGIERAAVLLAEHLVLVLAADAIVPRLHDAYARIDLGRVRFGWWLCGPSKTADIEQALVLGAHGAMRASVLLV